MYGPPGTGKTSTILALARDLFGPELYRSRILELNASDERGIQIVRDKIKNFARTTVSAGPTSAHVPPFKIIILDEADSMTPDAQAALRRVMEAHANVTRFCLICNYVTRIIDPLASRCAKFRFTSLNKDDIATHIQKIALIEQVHMSDTCIDQLIQVSNGDMRKAIMYLQSLSLFKTITPDLVHSIAGIIPDHTVNSILNIWQHPVIDHQDNIVVLVQQLVSDGWSTSQLVAQLFDSITNSPHFSSIHKSKLAVLFANVDLALLQGASEFLQLYSLIIEGCRIVC